ncbi:MAG TPA: branched-chain amino acid ABC transporter permease [Methylomirabilota bacterium]|jgi:branched-chain amino acid transport system permease protein|nr:branched-chain amino acid ABC transporter permease [Methylomirabilota bacterium]
MTRGLPTSREAWLGAATVAVLLALPAVLTSYAVTVFILIFFYGYLGQAWNVLGGYGGQLSAGHAAFVGVGAYSTTLLSMHWGLSPWIGMLVGGVLAAGLGAIIGGLGFRFGLRGFYFVLLTVAFAEVCRIVALNTDALGGALGLYITFTGDPWQLQFQDNRAYYYLALTLMLLATGVVALVERSRLGAYLLAIREDEDAAEALGVDTFRCKLAAIVLSAFLTGLGGAFYANYLFSLQPNAVFGIPLSVDVIIRPVVGGAGTLVGPLLGSLILSPLAEVTRIYFTRPGWAGFHLVIYGVLLIGIVLFLPRGAYPHLRRAWTRRRPDA